MTMPTRRGRRAQRISCHDAHLINQSIGLWAVPSHGVIVLVAPVADSARLYRHQAITLRDALDAAIAELPDTGM